MAEDKPWFVIAGGGTGGHLYPGLAVAQALLALQPEFDVTIFGTPRPIDEQLTGPRGYELVKQEVCAFPRKPWHIFRFLSAWHRSVKYAKERFKTRRPAVVLGLGGYAAGPPVIAAAKLKVPTALFNPDAMPGLANRYLASKVDRIFIQWRETADHFNRRPNIKCTGCPIRLDFIRVDREEAIRALKLNPRKKTLLITGASQGAWSINAAVMELVDFWKENDAWQILHLTGTADLAMCREKYKKAGVPARTLAFTEHMPYCMAAADLVISRAGASTLAEIIALGLPSVLMPYPFDRKKHQLANAKLLADCNAAELLEDANDVEKNAKNLRELLTGLMNSEARRRHLSEVAGAMGRHDAAQAIAEELWEMGRTG
ncbi:MAG: UDP-N-acetylglucosamine--N-acetylmuramyl-(pentapeptide) pyrophosphoryl-undecaprenol N-acetylglucosamine transferase [Phycisphaerales bacterium]|nr:UDP-N-acetylglucosamine--N-acetylmuramyl-(pentapeptide) pyrophosphoryl-undecaprenol N-acetylglucosamine transferase [Phycisphaerales bacterium]